MVMVGAAFDAGLTARTPHHPASLPWGIAAAPDVVTVPGCGTAAAPMAVSPTPGHVESFTVQNRQVLAYVPEADPAPGLRRLPVVYFLHGSPGTAEDWLSGAHMPAMLDRLRALGQLPPVLAIFPDGNGPAGAWWGQTTDGAATESWFVNHLIPAVDARFPTLGPSERGIAGVSAGGFGAVNLAIRHPGVFSWVASYSGVFTADPDAFGGAAPGNSPALTISSVPAAGRFPLFIGAGADDWQFRSETDRFIPMVHSLGWPQLQSEIVPGDHGWAAWAVEVHDSLVWLGGLWKADPALKLALSRIVADHACP